MDRDKVRAVLVPYLPPLSSTQVEAIAREIAKVSAEEISGLMKTFEEPKRARKESRESRLRK